MPVPTTMQAISANCRTRLRLSQLLRKLTMLVSRHRHRINELVKECEPGLGPSPENACGAVPSTALPNSKLLVKNTSATAMLIQSPSFAPLTRALTAARRSSFGDERISRPSPPPEHWCDPPLDIGAIVAKVGSRADLKNRSCTPLVRNFDLWGGIGRDVVCSSPASRQSFAFQRLND